MDISKFDEIEALEDNWNDNGAPAFSKELIEKAKRLVAKLPFPPEIFPTANGSIQLEYEKNNGDYLEIELFDDHIKMFTTKHFSYVNTNSVVDEVIYFGREE